MLRLIPVPSAIDKKTFKNCLLLFFVLSFAIYGKSISNNYSMDDEYVILNNKQVHGGIKKIPEIFRTTYATESKASFEYRPVVKATYAIEYQFFGESPHISHFLNVLLYALLLCLLFYVLLRLIPGYHYLFSLMVVLLFLVHPLHSEVVMSLKNRDTILSCFGFLLSLLFYLRFAENKGYINLFWGLFFLLFAVMSKKDSMTSFALIPFTIWFFRNTNWKKTGMIIASYIPVVITFRTASKSVANDTVRTLLQWENPLFIHSTLAQRMPQGFYSIYFYLKMFLFPHPLISYYGYDQVPIIGWGSIYLFLVLALLIITGYFIVKNWTARPLWIYGVLFFIITISMFTNVVVPVVGIVGERFAFIPSIGLCIITVDLLLTYFKIPLKNRTMKLSSVSNNFWIVTGIVLVLCGGKTFSRTPAWKDAYTLYKTDVETATESAHEHSLLAAASLAKVKTDSRLSKEQKRELVLQAEKEYLESLRIIPDYTSAHNNIGMLYYTYLGQLDKSIYHLQKAVTLDSTYVEAWFNLASCMAASKKYDTAEQYFLKVIKLNPKFTSSYMSLSNLYAMNKQYDKIIALNEDAISKGIKSDILYINLGNVYFMNGDTLKALPYLEKAIEFNPNNKGVNSFLSNYYQSKGDQAKAAYYSNLLSRSR